MFIISISNVYSSSPPPPFAINVPSAHVSAHYCPENGLVFNVDDPYTSTELAGGNYAYYDWTFEDALNFTSEQIFDPDGFTNLNTKSIIWREEGTFTITVTASRYNAFDQLIEQRTDDVQITIDATCCGSYGTFLTAIPTGRRITSASTVSGTYSGFYYVADDITISGSTTVEGTWIIDGDAVVKTPPGGSVKGEYITIDAVTFALTGGELRADCGDMWGGVEVVNGGRFTSSENASIKDSWNGIHYDLSSPASFGYNIQNTTFMNNRYGIQAFEAGTAGDHIITSCTFDSDPQSMLEPYIYNSGHNNFREYRMISAITYIDDSEVDYEYFNSNTIKNAMVGIDFSPGSALDFSAINCEFNDNIIAGFYANGAGDINLFEENIFEVPTDLPFYGYTQWNSVNGNYSTLGNGDIHAVAAVGSISLTIQNADIYPSSNDYAFATSYDRIGIYCYETNLDLSDSEITSMEWGIYLEETGTATLDENISTDQKYHYYIDKQGSGNVDLDMSCNSTRLDNVSGFQTYGIYVTSGTDMDDIGGDNTSPNFIPPSGNGWPADPASSPGFNVNPPCSTTTGGTLTLSNWNPYSNFTSINDANGGTPTWTYWAYTNEFVGTVSPSAILDRPGTTTNAPSCSVTNICFPLFRFAGTQSIPKPIDVMVFPNPSNGSFSIELDNEKEIDFVSLMSPEGKVMLLESNQDNTNQYFMKENLPGGLYFIEIHLKSGGQLRTKHMIHQ